MISDANLDDQCAFGAASTDKQLPVGGISASAGLHGRYGLFPKSVKRPGPAKQLSIAAPAVFQQLHQAVPEPIRAESGSAGTGVIR